MLLGGLSGGPEVQQDAADRGTAHPESLGELIVALSLLSSSFDDSDPQVVGDGCSHSLVKAQERFRASSLSLTAAPWIQRLRSVGATLAVSPPGARKKPQFNSIDPRLHRIGAAALDEGPVPRSIHDRFIIFL